MGWHACGSSPGVCVGCPGQAGRQGEGASAWTCPGEGGAPWEQPAALGDVMGEGGGELPGHVGWWQPPPAPASLSSRLDGPLPSGVRAEGDTLGFPPLTTEHSGIYVCHVSNELSSRDSQVTVDVLGKQRGRRGGLGPGLGGPLASEMERGNWGSADSEGRDCTYLPEGQAEGRFRMCWWGPGGRVCEGWGGSGI